MRILLFLATNIAVVLVASVMLRLLGVEYYLTPHGLNLNSLILFGIVFGFGGAFVSLALSKWMAKKFTGLHMVDTQAPAGAQQRWLVDTVRELSEQAKIAMPEVGIMPMEDANAFATGARRNSSLVAISQGMLNRFSPEEARAVMAHEIGHVANGDMVTLSLIQGVVNAFVFVLSRVIGHAVDRIVFRNQHGYGIGYFVATIIAQIVLTILASMVVMWFSRRREFRADAYSADLVSPDAMIGALSRLQAEQGISEKKLAMATAGGGQRGGRGGSQQNQSGGMPDELLAFGIRGGRAGGLRALFSSHPPLEQRIAALRAAA